MGGTHCNKIGEISGERGEGEIPEPLELGHKIKKKKRKKNCSTESNHKFVSRKKILTCAK